jgi:hypothetical protein
LHYGCTVSQSVTTTLLPTEHMAHTHTLVFSFFERGGISASFFFWQGSHFRMMFFFTLRFHLSSCWRTTPDFSVSGEAAARPRGWACENSAVVYFEPDAVRVNTPLVIMAPECVPRVSVPRVSLRRRTPGQWLTWVEPPRDRVAAPP